MKNMTKLLVLTSLLCTSVLLMAQDGPPPGRSGGRDGQRPPAPPIVTALDANQDGVIDATEIANATVALRKLDKNGDGKLTPDEFMGQRRGPGAQRGQRGQEGQGNRPQRPAVE